MCERGGGERESGAAEREREAAGEWRELGGGGGAERGCRARRERSQSMEGFEEDDLEAEDLDEMTSGDVTRTVKCLVVGNGHVGKSTYVRRFCRGKYEDEYKKTIGCVFGERP